MRTLAFLMLAIVGIIILKGSSAKAHGPSEMSRLLTNVKKWEFASYLRPNELFPEDMMPVTTTAPEGTLLSVGTERGFISLAINPQLQGLILVDVNPKVVLYNKINIALIQIARNWADYKKLRSHLFFRLVPQTKEVLRRVSEHMGAEPIGFDILRKFQLQSAEDFLESGRMAAIANYLKTEALFWRLKDLADQGRITAQRLDLKNEKQIENFISHFPQGEKLSLIDISNAWWAEFIKYEETRKLMIELQKISTDNATVLLTQTSKQIRRNSTIAWEYFGIPLNQFLIVGGEQDPISLLPQITAQNIVDMRQRFFLPGSSLQPNCRATFFQVPP